MTLRSVALGGIGGSGTRLGAAILQALDYFIGGDLNDPLDNLWFTLLFVRRSILLERRARFEELHAMFTARMRGVFAPTDDQRRWIEALAAIERHRLPTHWLAERARSFVAGDADAEPARKLAWKEPNTHVVIDRLFEADPSLRYIHFLRNPLYMAHSENQAQLHNWGASFLDRAIVPGPMDSLAYWCAAHRRIVEFARVWPDRIHLVDYDALVAEPKDGIDAIMRFLGEARIDAKRVETFLEKRPVRPPPLVDPSDFRAEDLRYIAALGYAPG